MRMFLSEASSSPVLAVSLGSTRCTSTSICHDIPSNRMLTSTLLPYSATPPSSPFRSTSDTKCERVNAALSSQLSSCIHEHSGLCYWWNEIRNSSYVYDRYYPQPGLLFSLILGLFFPKCEAYSNCTCTYNAEMKKKRPFPFLKLILQIFSSSFAVLNSPCFWRRSACEGAAAATARHQILLLVQSTAL